MKILKVAATAVVLLCVFFSLASCSLDKSNGGLKERLVIGYENMLEHMSKFALTCDKDLQGKRELNSDGFTGKYTAQYENFSGKEYIFGATCVNDGKIPLLLNYNLQMVSGGAVIYHISKGEKTEISSGGSGIADYSVSSGDDYIVIECVNFTGSVDLSVE